MGFINFFFSTLSLLLIALYPKHRDSFLELVILGLHESIEISVLN